MPAAEALRLDGLLERSVLSPQIHQILLAVARVRNAVSSFRLEGEHVELERARAIVAGAPPNTDSELGVARLTKEYTGIAEGRIPTLTIDGICKLHKSLFEGILTEEDGSKHEDWVGVLKPKQNAIVDATGLRLIATPPERTAAELDALLSWYQSVRSLWLPPVAAGVFFAEFQAIHPFMNGNGRIGRLLNVALLTDMGCKQAALAPIDLRFFKSSDHYYEYLGTTNSGRNYDLWNRYFVGEVVHAYRIARKQADLSSVLRRFSRPSTRAILRWILAGTGEWFSTGDLPRKIGYSQPAQWSSLMELKRAEIIESRGERRGRKYRLRQSFLADLYANRL